MGKNAIIIPKQLNFSAISTESVQAPSLFELGPWICDGLQELQQL